jgi:hypothetical protein
MEEIQYGLAINYNPNNLNINLYGDDIAPTRRSYNHSACGSITSLPENVAKTLAKHPQFYDLMYCISCRQHFPINRFFWADDRVQLGKIVIDEEFAIIINNIALKSSSCCVDTVQLSDLIAKEFNGVEAFKLYVLDNNYEVKFEVIGLILIELFVYNKFTMVETQGDY